MKNALKNEYEIKRGYRTRAIERRDSIPMDLRRQYDMSIQRRLFSLKEFREAVMVLFYASFRSEVNTELMISDALDMGKTVLLPRVHMEEKRLTKHEINGNEELSPGFMGIPEPVAGDECMVEDIHMLVIPGVAFDPAGARIGYGGGYYDKLLPRVKGTRTIAALAYEAQIFDELPTEPHDVSVDYIVTEKRTIDCHGQG